MHARSDGLLVGTLVRLPTFHSSDSDEKKIAMEAAPPPPGQSLACKRWQGKGVGASTSMDVGGKALTRASRLQLRRVLVRRKSRLARWGSTADLEDGDDAGPHQ